MSEIPDPVAYDVSQCVHEGGIASEPFDTFGPGGSVRALRRLPAGTLRSGIVTLPAGFAGAGALQAGAVVQFFVRSGALAMGDTPLSAGAFVAIAPGGVLPALHSDAGAELLVILDDEQAILPAVAAGSGDGVNLIPDVFAVDPIVPVINGRRLDGFERRVLWEDVRTGADTRLLRIPAGFEGAGGPSFHPVEEEIFCLEGDIAPDDKTPMCAGSFLWNPRLSVHGFREHTKGGCLLLEWHDGPWAFHKYEGPEGGLVKS